jgi:serine/threonine protein kinase
MYHDQYRSGKKNIHYYTPDLLPYPSPLGGLGFPHTPTLDAIGVDFLNKMMHHNPARRITAQEALEHQFFFDVVGHHMK